jgi:hypothetical protein
MPTNMPATWGNRSTVEPRTKWVVVVATRIAKTAQKKESTALGADWSQRLKSVEKRRRGMATITVASVMEVATLWCGSTQGWLATKMPPT